MSQENQKQTPQAEAEVVERETGLATRSIPVSIDEIAAQEGGEALVQRAIEIMKALRAASIALTHPSDWVLFKAENATTAFLQEVGCQRIQDLWGVEIYDLSPWTRTDDPDTKDFSYSITATGHSNRTGQTVYGITGTRYSYEPFITKRKLPALQIINEVQKAARANLNGNIVRELAGMKSVPIQELDLVWQLAKMSKTSNDCAKGRGFGTADERVGGASNKTGGLEPADIPVCDYCDPPVKLVYRESGNFWGCPMYKKHESKKMTINHDVLLKRIEERKKLAGDEH